MSLFKTIPGASAYSITNEGKIKNNVSDKFLMPSNSSSESYPSITLVLDNNERKTYYIHTLVAKLFINNPDNKPFVNHIDGNKKNFHYSNLEWITASENVKHWHDSKDEKSLNTKGVIQLDMNGNELARFKSIKEASEKTNSNQSRITQVCRGNEISSGGYKWRYIEDNYYNQPDLTDFTDMSEFDNMYSINKIGSIYSKYKSIILKATKNNEGYLRITLVKNGERNTYLVHRLVAATFLPKIEGKNIVNHINGVKNDNRVENLEWVNNSENTQKCVNETKTHKVGVPIIRYNKDKDGNIILTEYKKYNTKTAAYNDGYCTKASLNDYLSGKLIHDKYHWEVDKSIKIEKPIKQNKFTRPVNQLDLNGKFIKRFESIQDAIKAYPKCLSISDVCRGKTKTSGGYKWEYATNNINFIDIEFDDNE